MMKPTRPAISKGASYPPAFRSAGVPLRRSSAKKPCVIGCPDWLPSGQTLAVVAADLGLSPECLRSWRKQLEADSKVFTASATVPPTSDLALARENGQLRRELEAVTRQRSDGKLLGDAQNRVLRQLPQRHSPNTPASQTTIRPLA